MPIIKPFMTSLRFNSTIGAGTDTGATFAIAATVFSTHAGTAATAFPSTFAYNLYINGVLQPEGTSTVTTSTLTIPDGDAENDGVSVLVEFVVN